MDGADAGGVTRTRAASQPAPAFCCVSGWDLAGIVCFPIPILVDNDNTVGQLARAHLVSASCLLSLCRRVYCLSVSLSLCLSVCRLRRLSCLLAGQLFPLFPPFFSPFFFSNRLTTNNNRRDSHQRVASASATGRRHSTHCGTNFSTLLPATTPHTTHTLIPNFPPSPLHPSPHAAESQPP